MWVKFTWLGSSVQVIWALLAGQQQLLGAPWALIQPCRHLQGDNKTGVVFSQKMDEQEPPVKKSITYDYELKLKAADCWKLKYEVWNVMVKTYSTFYLYLIFYFNVNPYICCFCRMQFVLNASTASLIDIISCLQNSFRCRDFNSNSFCYKMISSLCNPAN